MNLFFLLQCESILSYGDDYQTVLKNNGKKIEQPSEPYASKSKLKKNDYVSINMSDIQEMPFDEEDNFANLSNNIESKYGIIEKDRYCMLLSSELKVNFDATTQYASSKFL